MPLSAFDALSRGVALLRTRWALVPWLMAASFLLSQLVAASVSLPVAALGLDLDFKPNVMDPEAATAWLGDLSSRLEVTPALLAALAGSLGLLLLAGLVYCFAQAGLYGVLGAVTDEGTVGAVGAGGETVAAVRADTSSRPGSPTRLDSSGTPGSPGTPALRQASDFAGAGGAFFKRYFGLLNLYGLFASLVLILALAAAGLASWGAARWGALAAFGMGCGLLIPIVLGGLACWAWYAVAQAELGRAGSNVRDAGRRGLEILRKRLGAVVLLLVLFGVASMTIQLAFAPFSALSAWLFGDRPFLARATEMILNVAASFPSAIADVVLAGSMIALVRSEGVPA